MITARIRAAVWMAASLALAGVGCQSTYYKMWEGMGKEKRDLLKDQVEEARDDQEKASEQFKDALTRLQELYAIPGGDLEGAYRKLKADFEKCEARAKDVKDRVVKVERIAGDLFTEWEEEIQTYSSDKLRTSSEARLNETRQKYQSLILAMKKAERGMEPVLVQFRDQVLYLKHNLNAMAIGALKGEALDIEKEIASLIADMNKSIEEADAFIGTL
jgi:hypothetical protein